MKWFSLKRVLSALLSLLVLFGVAFSEDFPFDKRTVELGTLLEGRETTLSFSLKNTLSEPIRIVKIVPSCGCTDVKPLTARLGAKEKITLTVTIDTTGKIGRILKSLDIYTDRRQKPYTVNVVAYVKHTSDNSVDRTVIFRDGCKRCHLGKNISNRYGEELYNALCYICHKKPEGIKTTTTKGLFSAIARGMKKTSMPAFSLKHGGVLTDRQVRSLVEFLLNVKSHPE